MKPDAVGAGSVDAILDAIRGAGIEILARRKHTLTPEDIAHLHGGGTGCCAGEGGGGGEGEGEDVTGSGLFSFSRVKMILARKKATGRHKRPISLYALS